MAIMAVTVAVTVAVTFSAPAVAGEEKKKDEESGK